MNRWRTSRAPVFFVLGLSLGVWGCAPDSDFGPASDGSRGAGVGIGVDHEANHVELAIHDLVNDYRADRGLDLLDFDDTVGAVARVHSDDMATGAESLGHSGFTERAEDVLDAVDNSTAVGENVGRVSGMDTEDDAAEAMLAFWQDSPDHDENMLRDDWGLTGVGVAQADDETWYFTQVFVGVN